MPHVWQMPWIEDGGRWWYRVFFDVTFLEEDYKVADLSPLDFRKQSAATDTTKLDPNIGFQGLALIQGQIYNPGSILGYGSYVLKNQSTGANSPIFQNKFCWVSQTANPYFHPWCHMFPPQKQGVLGIYWAYTLLKGSSGGG